MNLCRKSFQGLQNRFDPRDFVGAEQIGPAQRRQHGKERFGAAHFFPKAGKGVGQGVANRKTQRAQANRRRSS